MLGTKTCFEGPLQLLESIRRALGDVPAGSNSTNASGMTDGPGDRPQSSSETRSRGPSEPRTETGRKSDETAASDGDTTKKRHKMP